MIKDHSAYGPGTRFSGETPQLIPFQEVLDKLDISTTTGWRYRKRGWIKTIKIAGKLYVNGVELRGFLARATAGEYASLPSTTSKEVTHA